jgi:hypothetical protein
MSRRIAAGAAIAALAVFPAGAGATNMNGNSDAQGAPECEIGQSGAALDNALEGNIGQALNHGVKSGECANERTPDSSPN